MMKKKITDTRDGKRFIRFVKYSLLKTNTEEAWNKSVV